MAAFRLTFAGSGAAQVYLLAADGALLPESAAPGSPPAAKPDGETVEVLILPASEALPFQVEVPFPDPEKIARVLPQLVADRFARVTPDWRLSWVSNTAEGKTRVAGLAFPPSSLRRPAPDRPAWRIIVPDLMLANPSEPGWHAVLAPFSRGAVEIDGTGAAVRFHVGGRGLPDPRESSDRASFELVREGVALLRGCSLLLDRRDGRDLSDWHAARRERLTKVAAGGAAVLLLGLAVLWHLFLAWECARLEERRRQLNLLLNRSFERVFPGQRAVEPLLQARKLLEGREREAEKRAPEPVIPWKEFLGESLGTVREPARIETVAAGPGGWRIQGVIGSYRELSSLTAALPRTELLRHGQTRETSPLKGSGPGVDGLRFVLEGPWKR